MGDVAEREDLKNRHGKQAKTEGGVGTGLNPTGNRTEREDLEVRDEELGRQRGGERNRVTTRYSAKKEEAEQQGQGARQRELEKEKYRRATGQRGRNETIGIRSRAVRAGGKK